MSQESARIDIMCTLTRDTDAIEVMQNVWRAPCGVEQVGYRINFISIHTLKLKTKKVM